jgi:hypothetical protein
MRVFCTHGEGRIGSIMAARKKITPEMEAEILRRRRAGERIRPIARDFNIAHQTVSKLEKRDALRKREQAADQESAPGGQASVSAKQQPAPEHLPPKPFASWEERFCYYQSLSLESENDWLNFKDV